MEIAVTKEYGVLELTESLVASTEHLVVKYEGRVGELGEGRVSAVGTFTDSAGLHGRFAAQVTSTDSFDAGVALEPAVESTLPMAPSSPSDVHAAGVWVGESIPHTSLASFLIPTNPIHWSLVIDVQGVGKPPVIFGGGYFDDSGDVPNHSVLAFTLERGSVPALLTAAAKRTNLSAVSGAPPGLRAVPGCPVLAILKRNERVGSAAGVTVVYIGRLSVDPTDGSLWLTGVWQNHAHHTFGTFYARRTPASCFSRVAVLCDACSAPIRPGKTRWAGSGERGHCALPWTLCAACWSRGQGEHPRPHFLAPAVSCQEVLAVGSTCGQLVADAISRFRDRPFIGTRALGKAAFAYRTYGDVGQQALAVARRLAAAGVVPGAFVAVVSGTSPSMVTVAMAALLGGCVLVPLATMLPAATMAHILGSASPQAVFVEEEAVSRVAAALKHAHAAPLLCCVLGPAIDGQPVPEWRALVAEPAASPSWVQFAECCSAGGAGAATEGAGGRVLGAAAGGSPTSTQSPPPGAATTTSTQPPPPDASTTSAQPPPPPGAATTCTLDTTWLVPERSPSDPVALLFTSGSTGRPKGALFSEELSLPTEGSAQLQPFVRLDFQRFDPTFVLSLLSTMQCGGSRAIGSGLQHLMEDVRAAEPTHVGTTPAFWNALHTLYNETLAQLLLENAGAAVQREHAALEQVAARHVRSSLGRRLQLATSGGAPLSSPVLQFVREHLRVDLISLYGTCETGGIARDGMVYPGVDVMLMPLEEECGAEVEAEAGAGAGTGAGAGADPTIPTAIRRGKVCVASPWLITGYFNDPEATARAFITIGGKTYYRTGNVGELVDTPEGRRVRLLDRCGAMIKLSQGEWIAPADVESVLEGLPAVAHVLILARSERPFPVAVVVPSQAFLSQWRAQPERATQASNSDDTHVRGDEQARAAALLREVRRWGAHHHLRPMQLPQALHVECEPWTAAAGLLTEGSLKKVRRALESKYASVRDALYEELDVASSGEASGSAGTDQGSSSSGNACAHATPSLSPEFRALLSSSLASSADPLLIFAECGGDSLEAALLIGRLAHAGLQLSMSALHEYSLGHIGDMLDVAHEAAGAGAETGPGAAATTTTTTTTAAAATTAGGTLGLGSRGRGMAALTLAALARPVQRRVDWDTEMTLPRAWADSVRHAAHQRQHEREAAGGVFRAGTPTTVITGGTGFLGPLIVAAVISQTRHVAHHRIVCVVHAASDAAARQRLLADAERAEGLAACVAHAQSPGTVAGSDGVDEVEEREGLETTAGLIVVAGDVSLPRFGFPECRWAELARTTTSIIHNAAHVDMHLPYAKLKAVNVTGALSAAALAAEARATLLFVSSVGALATSVPVPATTTTPLSSSGSSSSGNDGDRDNPSHGSDATVAAQDVHRPGVGATSVGMGGDGWARPTAAQLDGKSGYGASKAVAEALLVQAARAFALDLRILRPSAISGSTVTGYANSRDATVLLLSAITSSGVAPADSALPLRWVPVDFVSDAIARLTFGPADLCAGKAFNLLGAGPPLQLAVNALRQMGLPISDVPQGQWAQLIDERLPDSHPARPLLPSFQSMNFGANFHADLPSTQQLTTGARFALASLGLEWPETPTVEDVARQALWLRSAGAFGPEHPKPLTD